MEKLNLKTGKDIRKILIINLGGIGDLLFSIPALRALRDTCAGAKISLLVVPRVYEIVKGLPYADETVIFYKQGRYFLKNLKTLFSLRQEKFDLAINMRTLVSDESAKKIKFLLELINPKVKAGRDTEGRGSFFDIRISETQNGQKYEMEYDIDTMKALGVEVVDRTIDLKVDAKDYEESVKMLRKEGICNNDLVVGIHPGGMFSRRWKIDNFAKLMDGISKELKCKFAITGGKDEANLAGELAGKTKQKIADFTGKLTLNELNALIKRCNLFISNDTGPMHIAAILKTPLVAIFGPGDITRYDPRNIFDKAEVLYKKVDCSPCNKVRCSELKCLNLISPEEVIAAAVKVLKLS